MRRKTKFVLGNVADRDGDVIWVASMTSNRRYKVDLVHGRCSCPSWIYQRGGSRKPCKHLRALGFTETLESTKGIPAYA